MADSATTTTDESSCVSQLSEQIADAKTIRGRGPEGNKECISILTSVISRGALFNPTNLSKDEQCLLCGSLVDAHCLRALCTQEETSCSKQIFLDVKDALKKCAELVNTHQMSPNSLTLLYHVLDLLYHSRAARYSISTSSR